eukprot:TRINITY_DN3963_c0_g1_i2.p1 TRINITY_DN3963_c0_g1~~TRINITY_DN3963_c0_g1_i2.p1  ORF type:complete len:503 (-),score=122.69 TRINITY_DN3963_c0_g1_i2:4-1413(-)
MALTARRRPAPKSVARLWMLLTTAASQRTAVDQATQNMEQLTIQPAASSTSSSSSSSQPQQTSQVVLPKAIETIFMQLRSDLVREKITSIVDLRVAGLESHPGLKKIKEWCLKLSFEESKRKQGMSAKAVETLNLVLQKLVELFDLENVEVYHLPHVALLCGSVVEFGADEELGRRVILFLKQALAKSAKVSKLLDKLGEEYTQALSYPINKLEVLLRTGHVALDDIKHWRLLKIIVLPVMTMIAKNIFLRMELRADKEFMHSLREHTNAIEEEASIADSTIWLNKTLALEDDIDVLVLHPELQQGCIVETEAIFNCYHFFTLLQDALNDKSWGQKRTIPPPKLRAIVEIAKGERDVDTSGSRVYMDAAQWDYYQWTGLDGENPGSKIYGPGLLSRVLKFSDDGVPEMPVIILKRSNSSRNPMKWTDEYFEPLHSSLLSEVCVKKFLTKEEVQQYVTKIRSKQEIVLVS